MKIAPFTIDRWTKMAATFLQGHDLTPSAIKTGSDAWTVASRAMILHEAYDSPDIVDAHIQTALEKVFPNAVFKDKKRY